jgi:hypothetical protein
VAEQPKADPHLEAMLRKHMSVRDDVASVALGYVSSYILWGPSGTGKTWVIKDQLREMNVAWREPAGTMTALALFRHLQRFSDDITFIEDQEGILKDPKTLDILRPALWTTERDPTNQGRIPPRRVQWTNAHQEEEVFFGGGIILVQNGAPPRTQEVNAVLSRGIARNLTASTDELNAMARHLAATAPPKILGYTMTSVECSEVAELVIEQTRERGRALNLKLLDICYGMFVQFQQGASALHWRDRVTSLIMERAPRDCLHRVDLPGSTRLDRQERDHEIVRQILRETSDPKEQVRLWAERTEKAKSMFYERRKEVERMG